ncbi:MAG: histidine kinase [Desulfuromonas sp.]|nr:MAG: histidine kinase [Desulfuromonas sp.]
MFMTESSLLPYPASPEKALPQRLARQIQVFQKDQFLRQMLNAIPSLLAVLNEHRQIIYANQSLIEMLEVDSEDVLFGQRPGDVFECVHTYEADTGCGTGESCRSCGALKAIMSQKRSVEECRMTRLRQSLIQAHELEVTSTPFEYADEQFTIFSIEDKSAEHRRQMLERIFFHDIMNIVGSIRGFTEILEEGEIEEPEAVYRQIREAADQVIGEVNGQRLLSDAEQGRLELNQEFCSSLELLQRTVRLYGKHRAVAGRQLIIDDAAVNEYLVTDQNLVLRILGNMVLNAVEAVAYGETVRLDCRCEAKEITFTVQNSGVIPAEVQREIFQRTYSTKGSGRGLGTYSMRLLSNFLDGGVGFSSDEEQGTIFCLKIPQNLQ